MLTTKTIVCRSQDTVSTKLEDQVVMMDVDCGEYYSFNSVATRIWELLENQTRIQDICDSLVEEFEVSPEVCQEKVTSFVEKLVEYKVVKIIE